MISCSICLCLTYFTKHNTLQVHPCCCKWQNFILFHGWVHSEFFTSSIVFFSFRIPIWCIFIISASLLRFLICSFIRRYFFFTSLSVFIIAASKSLSAHSNIWVTSRSVPINFLLSWVWVMFSCFFTCQVILDWIVCWTLWKINCRHSGFCCGPLKNIDSFFFFHRQLNCLDSSSKVCFPCSERQVLTYFLLALAGLVGVCLAYGLRVSKRLAQHFWIEFGLFFGFFLSYMFYSIVELLCSLWALSSHFSI